MLFVFTATFQLRVFFLLVSVAGFVFKYVFLQIINVLIKEL